MLNRRVDKNTRLTFEVQEVTFSSADSLALADNHSLEHLLSQLGLTLLDRAEEHVSDRAAWVSVETSTKASHSDHVQVLGTSVVSAVHD